MLRCGALFSVAVVFATCVSSARAQAVEIQTVRVGNPGNPGDARYPDPQVTSFGGVAYAYNIGKFELTAGQYRDFLNAVDPAGSNPYGLYSDSMDSSSYGCQITWNAGSSTYDFSGRPSGTEADWGDRPVNYVSWGDAARFCNWLHNGQPTGQLTGDPTQDVDLTEDGSYYLNGAMTAGELIEIMREPDATWVIPSEDEWYKAAYHYDDGVTGNYYDYPTSSGSVPGYVDNSGNLSGTGTPFIEGGTDPGNHATYDGDDGTNGIGSPYYRTLVGEWEKSGSPYGSSDQAANVWEWNEAVRYPSGLYRVVRYPSHLYRVVRGGSFRSSSWLHAANRYDFGYVSTDEHDDIGFRVAEVPKLGDSDADGDVDLADFVGMQNCFTGEGPAELRPLCLIFDFEPDDDVDLSDYAILNARLVRQSAPPCGMTLLPGGEFQMGDHHDGNLLGDAPLHAVYVDSFYIDTCEVTNQQYCTYLNVAYPSQVKVVGGVVYGTADTGNDYPYCNTYEYDDHSRIHFSAGTFTVTPGKQNHPMVEVSWYGAAVYANWRSQQDSRTPCYNLTTWQCDFDADGYRLPTEAEWEYAARGGQHNPYYRYPWGDTIDGSTANYGWSGDPYETGYHPWTTPVAYYDGWQTPPGVDMANGYGPYDMAGNVWEWCHDWYAFDYYYLSPYSNPRGPGAGTFRVLRGGSGEQATDLLRCAFRYASWPVYAYKDYGFRLVRD
jgi:formylglycine-generating enzyme required for sulfatase activity